MLLEIRRYSIQPGRRDEFVAWFESTVLPAMEAKGMRILGQFVSTEDPDAFIYLRSFSDQEERDRQYRAFYESSEWLDGMREQALAMETGYRVEVVRPTSASKLR